MVLLLCVLGVCVVEILIMLFSNVLFYVIMCGCVLLLEWFLDLLLGIVECGLL